MLDTAMKVSLTLVAFDKMSKVIKDAVSQSNEEFDKLQRKVKQVSDVTKEICFQIFRLSLNVLHNHLSV